MKRLDELGKEMVSCKLECKGMCNEPKNGIIPRCLFLERRKGIKRCIVVGLNAGKSREKEHNFYKTKGISYDSVKAFYAVKIKKHS